MMTGCPSKMRRLRGRSVMLSMSEYEKLRMHVAPAGGHKVELQL